MSRMIHFLNDAIEHSLLNNPCLEQVMLLLFQQSKNVRAAVATTASTDTKLHILGVSKRILSMGVLKILQNLYQNPSLLVVWVEPETPLSILHLTDRHQDFIRLQFYLKSKCWYYSLYREKATSVNTNV